MKSSEIQTKDLSRSRKKELILINSKLTLNDHIEIKNTSRKKRNLKQIRKKIKKTNTQLEKAKNRNKECLKSDYQKETLGKQNKLVEKIISDCDLNIVDIRKDNEEKESFGENVSDVKEDQDDSGFTCNICHKTFTHHTSLRGHLKVHTPKKHQCSICQQIFRRKSFLERHKVIHTDDNPYRCRFCGKDFKRNDNLKIHLRIHSENKPYQCDVCGKGFTQVGNLQSHQRVHAPDKAFKCDICAEEFALNSELLSHVLSHGEGQPFKCTFCGRVFGRKDHLDKHELKHTDERPFTCDVCGVGYLTKFDLKSHERTHTDEKSFICDYCGKGFHRKSSLKYHIRTHTGARPYTCDICGKSYRTNSYLHKHVMIHTGYKPHKCDFCNKAFISNSDLTVHVRTHTGIKPYKCSMCDKAFNEAAGLRKHENIHKEPSAGLQKNSDAKAYKCSICHMDFLQRTDLFRHRKTQHTSEAFDTPEDHGYSLSKNQKLLGQTESMTRVDAMPHKRNLLPPHYTCMPVDKNDFNLGLTSTSQACSDVNAYSYVHQYNHIDVLAGQTSSNSNNVGTFDVPHVNPILSLNTRALASVPSYRPFEHTLDITDSANFTCNFLQSNSQYHSSREQAFPSLMDTYLNHNTNRHSSENNLNSKNDNGLNLPPNFFNSPSRMEMTNGINMTTSMPIYDKMAMSEYTSPDIGPLVDEKTQNNCSQRHNTAESGQMLNTEYPKQFQGLNENAMMSTNYHENLHSFYMDCTSTKESHKNLQGTEKNMGMLSYTVNKELNTTEDCVQPGEYLHQDNMYRDLSDIGKSKLLLKQTTSLHTDICTSIPDNVISNGVVVRTSQTLPVLCQDSTINAHKGSSTASDIVTNELDTDVNCRKEPSALPQSLHEADENGAKTDDVCKTNNVGNGDSPVSNTEVGHTDPPDIEDHSGSDTEDYYSDVQLKQPTIAQAAADNNASKGTSNGSNEGEMAKCFGVTLTVGNTKTRKIKEEIDVEVCIKRKSGKCDAKLFNSAKIKNKCIIKCLKSKKSALKKKPSLLTYSKNVLNKKTCIGSYVCEICGSDYDKKISLTSHMKVHQPKQNTCDICGKAFRRKSFLRRHSIVHTDDNPYRCNVCGKDFKRKEPLQIHMRIHMDNKPYQCDVCGKGFTQMGNLHSHQRVHAPDKAFKCDVCGVEFSQNSELLTHILSHGKVGEPHKCFVCGRVFGRKDHLDKHILIHTDERPYKCKTCGTGFFAKFDLKSHEVTHSNEKSFVCDICGKGFNHRSSLKYHMRTHTGARPYPCDVCGKSYRTNSYLHKHRMIHTGYRPYNCGFCNKAFISNSDLTVHVRTHTGLKPHKCKICDKGFNETRSLKKHLNIHKSENVNTFPFTCNVCGTMFTEPKVFQEHLRVHLNVNVEKEEFNKMHQEQLQTCLF